METNWRQAWASAETEARCLNACSFDGRGPDGVHALNAIVKLPQSVAVAVIQIKDIREAKDVGENEEVQKRRIRNRVSSAALQNREPRSKSPDRPPLEEFKVVPQQKAARARSKRKDVKGATYAAYHPERIGMLRKH